ncbi:ankyrin repeat-containing domain protein [Nemania serpens]|nr:ankyrin repeat-containing domain protein [Nemania serpens]
MTSSCNNPLTKAAHEGDLDLTERLLAKGAGLNCLGLDDITPLIAAAIAGRSQAVTLLLNNGADVKMRDVHGQSVIKLAIDHGEKSIAEAIVDRYPNMVVNDPRLPKGEAWLREQFRLISERVRHVPSRPDPALLERVISGKLEPVDGRKPADIYWEHILLCLIGDRPADFRRNYDLDGLKQARTGTVNGTFEGGEGLERTMKRLHSLLPTNQYVIVGTYVEETNATDAWVTERWGYYDVDNDVQVTDGIDTFLIEDGKIRVKWANYTVRNQVDSRSEFNNKVGIKGALYSG